MNEDDKRYVTRMEFSVVLGLIFIMIGGVYFSLNNFWTQMLFTALGFYYLYGAYKAYKLTKKK